MRIEKNVPAAWSTCTAVNSGLQPDALLHCRCAGGVGVELVLPDVHEVRVDVIDAIRGQQPIGQLGQPADTLGLRHIERVDVIGRDPRRLGVHRLVGEDDRDRS